MLGGDEKLTTALMNRLAHHAVFITTNGETFRMRKRGESGEDAPTKARSRVRTTDLNQH